MDIRFAQTARKTAGWRIRPFVHFILGLILGKFLALHPDVSLKLQLLGAWYWNPVKCLTLFDLD